jgi:hypothetical protein
MDDMESAVLIAVTELQRQLNDSLKQLLKPITQHGECFVPMYEVLSIRPLGLVQQSLKPETLRVTICG